MRKEYVTARFSNTGQQAREVATWGSRYLALVDRLGQLGSQVHVGRTLECDRDVEPHRFVRGAVHRFVFPPQPVIALEDNSKTIDSTPGYGLQREEITYGYDPTQVSGHLEIAYDDADSRISFSVTDLKGGSELPEDVLAALAQVDMAFES